MNTQMAEMAEIGVDSAGEDEVVILQLHNKIRDVETSDEEDDNGEMTLEEAFRKVGYFGWFQIRFLLIKLLYQFPAVFNTLAITFVGLVPAWTCSSDAVVSDHIIGNDTSENCVLYEDDFANCTPVYNDHFYSIAQEWELLCDRSYLINLTQSGFFLGYLLGAYIFGSLADLIGRRKVTIGTILLMGLVQILIGFSTNVYTFAVGRFIVGLLIPGGTTAFILFCEITDSSRRSLATTVIGAVFGFAFAPMALTAYVLANWRWLTILAGILNIGIVLFYRYIPESPRWLLVVGKEMEAKNTFVEISRVNNRPLSSGFLLKPPLKPSKSCNFLAFMRNGTLRIRILLLMIEWFTLVLVYYALSLGVGSFSSNIYLAFTLSGLVEVPSSFFIYFTLQKFGRKWSNVVPLFIAGASCMCCSVVLYYQIDSSGYLSLTLSLIGKFSVTAVFTVIYIYTPELVPTDLRSSGMGIVNVCGRVGGILAPLIILLDKHVIGLSMLIMGVLGIVSSLLSLYLPETLNTPLPNTIAEMSDKSTVSKYN